jgi:hypothetical protein
MHLNGSVFMQTHSIDEDERSLTWELGEEPDHLGRRLDYASSVTNFEKLLGREVFVLGKGPAVGRVSNVKRDAGLKRIFVTAAITDDVAWRKVAANVFKGAQCRIYTDTDQPSDVRKYSGSPGALCLVDAPFDNATVLRKGARPGDAQEELAKALASRDFDELSYATSIIITDLHEEVAKLRAEPLPPKAAASGYATPALDRSAQHLVKAAATEPVTLSADEVWTRIQAMPPQQRDEFMTRAALNNPPRLGETNA